MDLITQNHQQGSKSIPEYLQKFPIGAHHAHVFTHARVESEMGRVENSPFYMLEFVDIDQP